MEPVKELVQKAIPTLSVDEMEALLTKLAELGVTCVDELIDVEAEDLVGTLTVVKARKLIRIIRAGKYFSCTALRMHTIIL